MTIINIKELEKLLKFMEEGGVAELEASKRGTSVRIVRSHILPASAEAQHAPPPIKPAITSVESSPVKDAASEQEEIEEGLVPVKSPIVGTFYRRPAPDAESFVSLGDKVKAGDTLCIVEAMKLMNEIEAPQGGTIEKILLDDGHVVEYEEVLFLIRPS